MFDAIKKKWILEKEFTETNYKSFGLHRKELNRFWWWYVFNNWLFDQLNNIITCSNNITEEKLM